MSDKIRNKIWNIELVVKDIKAFPQTYNTILKELSDDGTCQIILRRKLNILFKQGTICKTTIPGTRFGKVIYYTIPKDYNILIEAGRTGSTAHCFFDFKNLSKNWIEVNPYWILKGGVWVKQKGSKKILNGNVLKWV